ncbi:HesA/MoeB/ThiF family protein [Micromonospora mirobrigensis]|uniref:Molybdopterin or thiamine biosynthesis adenylyltransferase n=1 Tax=Micromonospora mirobrigensis TaxID=262898 RepID=A0A1C4YLS4_9ACTN|nr:ThiF family adenylyltransferase [Micromonospora mirobrigensis]SCF21610.1 Molybdopterin or thiamine biosynthesis adenylyltransferase [Micromonospora mirobrigensis]
MRRPRIKPEHAPYRVAGSAVRIGGPTYGVAAQVDDPDGAVWTLLESMDGSRDVDEIVRRVHAAHPTETPDGIRAALRRFVEAGYVEDVGAPEPAELSGRDRERFDRSRAYFRWLDLTPRASTWEPQVALSRARVTLVGVGGTGGVAAMALAASGVGRLVCVDPDVVELSNLNRQVLYQERDIGRPKADAAAHRLRRLNSAVRVTGLRQRITGPDDVAALAARCDVLVLSADRPQPDVRIWTNRACLATGTPWVDAGYHGPLVQVGSYVPGAGPCWECVRAADADRHHAAGVRYADAERRNAAVANAVAAPSAGISGYLAAHHALALITGVPARPPGRVDAVNLMALDATFTLDDPRRPDCPACGTLR